MIGTMDAAFPRAAFPGAADPIAWWARIAPERVALVDRARERRLSYSELDSAAARWAAMLARAGVRAGGRVAAAAGNRSELIELFLGCLRAGVALVPLNWRLAPAELAWVIADARPELIVGEDRFRSATEEALRIASLEPGTEPRWIGFEHDAPALLARAAAHAEGGAHDGGRADDETAALILYTSGSTGRPKGAILPRRQLFYNAIATTIGWELGASDVAPISTPLFHTGGWNVFALPLWHVGGRVVMFDQFDAGDFLDGLASEGCTAALTVPTQLLILTESAVWGRDLPALRFLISGGAPCPPALSERVRSAGYRFREGYGLTECGPNCFATTDAAPMERPGTVGWPSPFLEIRLVGDGGVDAPEGEPGELWLRGPQRFAGYLNQPERTREAIDDDGWLRTGDLARRDRARGRRGGGAYWICGRKKEMYISGGENVFPGEVEAALAGCPGAAEVVVVGVPDARWGEVGRAFVVRRSGDGALAERELIAFARGLLAGYKVPKSVVFLDEMPRLGSGKPDRRRLATWPKD